MIAYIVPLVFMLLALGAWFSCMMYLRRISADATARAGVMATVACFWALLLLTWAVWAHR